MSHECNWYYYYYYYYFPPQYHHMSSQTSWSPPSRLWVNCNRLLRLGRPVGAVTLSRWEWWWNERWIWGAGGALNLISTNYPEHGHHGRLPLSRKNAHRTRDLNGSSRELWPLSHEAGHLILLLSRHVWKGIGREWGGLYTVVPSRNAADCQVRSAATLTTDTSCQWQITNLRKLKSAEYLHFIQSAIFTIDNSSLPFAF